MKTFQSKQDIRLLKFLACGAAAETDLVSKSKDNRRSVTLRNDRENHITVPLTLINKEMSAGLIEKANGKWKLSSVGKSHLRRRLCEDDGFQEQHQVRRRRLVEVASQKSIATANLAESPLSRLQHVKRPDGKSYLEESEFKAGERIRADFTRANLMQRTTSNWSAAVCEGIRTGSSDGLENLTDMALDNRRRTVNALQAVGPELAGVIVDICCFLKGLELVERERKWPSRSAKLMLKTGLAMLARHYGYSAGRAGGRKWARIQHWGADGYKPTVQS